MTVVLGGENLRVNTAYKKKKRKFLQDACKEKVGLVANEEKNKYVHISSPNAIQNYNIKTINKSLETGKVKKFRNDVKIKIKFTKTLRADYTRRNRSFR
jgi:F0F1-type ATP synthase delta subunit